MTLRPLHPALLRHLRRIQQSTCVGADELAHNNTERSARTVYRWHHALGGGFLAVPSVLVEQLGLWHAHVFIHPPQHAWADQLPYAVEALWGTPDLIQDVLYVHCLVPRGHQEALVRLVGKDTTIVWSTSGWQSFLAPNEPITLPLCATNADATDLLRHHPLTAALVGESWQYPNSMPAVWTRIVAHTNHDLRSYVRHARVRMTNGKSYVHESFRALATKGLIRQHVIRYHPLLAANIEVFVMIRGSRDNACNILEALRDSLRAIEAYPAGDGYFCRLLGPHQLVDAISGLPLLLRCWLTLYCFNAKRHPAPSVRFCYETLFDPRTGMWREAR